MSSILGVCSFRDRINTTNFKEMSKVLAHAGNKNAFYLDKDVALYARVNLFSQPVYNKDRSIVMVCDGRSFDSNRLGYFLESYEQYGEEFIKQVKGVFALAIWDSNKKKLLLYKDRLSTKPLFFYYNEDNLVFCSEQKGILKYENYKLDYDAEAIRNFLAFGYNFSNNTLFKEIKKLPAGCYAVFSKEGLEIKKYWKVKINEDYSKSEEYLSKKLRELLLKSVKERLIDTDKPVAAFMSGGVDSGGTVGLLRQFTDKINTFSVGFAGYGFDELKRARKTAEFYGTNHTEINLKPDILKDFGKIVYALDEPMADLATLPNYVMSEYAKKKGLQQVFSGETNDEVWGGYEEYVEVPRRVAFSKLFFPGIIGKKIVPSMISLLPNSKVKTLIDHCDRYYDPIRCYNRQVCFHDEENMYSTQFKQKINLNKKPKVEITRDYIKGSGSLNNRLLLKSINSLAIQGYIVKADRMTRIFGLDYNMPLIDSDIVEFSFTVPFKYKVRRGVEKYLYRQALKEILPPFLLTRKKRGFDVPTRLWIPELKEHVLHFLDDQTLEKRSIFNKGYIHKLIEKINNPNVIENQDLWNLLVLEIGFRIYFEGMNPRKKLF